MLLYGPVSKTISKRNARINHRHNADAVRKSSMTRKSAIRPMRTAEPVSSTHILDDIGHSVNDIDVAEKVKCPHRSKKPQLMNSKHPRQQHQ